MAKVWREARAEYLKNTGLSEMEIFKSSLENKGESLLTFETRVYHIKWSFKKENLAAMFREGSVGELTREGSVGNTPAIQGQRWDQAWVGHSLS